ncbi:SulP family inorganic anion transporter [Hydrogenophaga sp.]|uniref:SulP family inorganic anion transporter n=1 Tax=Hydrogenophaga sp. TaxID=1904254 RepID=UPI00272F225A|nr:SulP family inorganic anion transporter [Hydrogenophaga sp.]MDP2016553.1 SulP family inorganic anion transporter [Hydrogenophaga sp.]MDP3166804.1 SulP family inorganic anion transporter [Hydrogenophaga sp.]MDP3833327.1 SulP family inorganic anion transporter [Hydrogenophaga sp.]
MSRLKRLLPFLNWPRPDAALMRGEAMAGLTVGLMVVPQGVAYAALAGMPLITGIYASLLPALIAVLFSASVRLSVGPTALTCLLISASLSGLAEPGSAQWIALAVWLALLSGLLQIVLGFARFGWLLNLVNSPVLMAFTQGAAVLIIASQLPALLGLGNWDDLFAPAHVHLPSLAFGLGSLAALMLARRWRPGFPTVLAVVVASAGISYAVGFEAGGGAVVGTLPQGLPTPYLPTWPGWSVLGQLLLPTLVITLVSFLETASSAKVDSGQRGQRWDQDQDLIGQGLAKLVSGFCGAFPTSSSFSRSALNLYAGARTGWATVFSVVVVLVALLVLTPLLHHVPMAVLAAIVLVAILGLIKPRAFVQLWALSRVEAGIAGVTLAVTLLAAPRLYWGVLAGVLMALSHFLYLRLHPRIIEVGLHPDGSLRDRHLWLLPPLAPDLYALRMDAALDFATANGFERAIAEHIAAHPGTRHVMLIAHPINWIDATGAEAFGRLREHLDDQRIELHLVGIKLPVEDVLKRAGFLGESPRLHLYRTEAEALRATQALSSPAS